MMRWFSIGSSEIEQKPQIFLLFVPQKREKKEFDFRKKKRLSKPVNCSFQKAFQRTLNPLFAMPNFGFGSAIASSIQRVAARRAQA